MKQTQMLIILKEMLTELQPKNDNYSVMIDNMNSCNLNFLYQNA